MPAAVKRARAQYAALPWRRDGAGAVEVMLITSRETRRWVIPKGWPMKGRTPPDSAAREAFEEAGVLGEVGGQPVGVFHYDKRRRSGRTERVRVVVFPLAVIEQRQDWPEKSERELAWLVPSEAATRVDEVELQQLIAAFAP